MEQIGVRELRQHASRYLALVREGQTVEVTDRGSLVALLVPVQPGRGEPTNQELLDAEREERV
ncbi:MAG: type II toxin-antitoxin system Phd/YefM family antitoxin [Acidimicrobiales bacterium]